MISRTIRRFEVAVLSVAMSFAGSAYGEPQHGGSAPARKEVSSEALNHLVKQAEQAHSDALVVYHRGKLLGEWYFGKEPRPIETMSVTKSIVNLIVGRLHTVNRFDSLDMPVATYYPEWKQGRKKDITVRHLLNHTSGIQNVPRADLEIYPSPDVVQLALTAELTDEPGTHWSYNNKAVNLLAGVIEKASGQRMDLAFKETLADPLGIKDFEWTKDQSGNPYAMAGLKLHAKDLAKLGQLVANRGVWDGNRLIDDAWFTESLKPATDQQRNCGLLWWLIYDTTQYVVDDATVSKLTEAGIDPAFVEKVRKLRGEYDDSDAYTEALRKIFGEGWQDTLNEVLLPHEIQLSRKKYGNVIGYRGDGYLGQYVVVYPDLELVAVRMIAYFDDYNPQTDSLSDFPELVRKLVATK